MEVCPQSAGRPWKVIREGDVAGECMTQALAIVLARMLIDLQIKEGHTVTLKIKRPNGKIRDERTYPRSSDPKRSKG